MIEMKRVKIVIIVLVLVVLTILIGVSAFCGCGLSDQQRRIIGRDTVRQWGNGSYGILRAADTYSFVSADSTISIDDITHYYEDNMNVYLIGKRDLFARVDMANRTSEIHSSVNEFSDDDQLVFEENEFVEVKSLVFTKNIWDILFRK